MCWKIWLVRGQISEEQNMDASHAFDPKLFASKIQNTPTDLYVPHQAKQLNHANKAAMSSEVVPKGYLNGYCGNLRKGVLWMGLSQHWPVSIDHFL